MGRARNVQIQPPRPRLKQPEMDMGSGRLPKVLHNKHPWKSPVPMHPSEQQSDVHVVCSIG